jgi:DNA-binding NarL/FixJ family response regulator
VQQLEEAVAVLEPSPARLELAKALAALGSTLRRERKPTEAREPLRRAMELAELCDAAGLEAQVRTELYATGSRPRATAMTGPAALTASEKRVAELAAEGLTNRDIAQTLFVTPKTVEVHLSATYRKLGIRSRRELAGSFAAA